MKKNWIITCSMICSLIFSACQSTPAEDVVVGKSDETLKQMTEVAEVQETYYDPGVESWQTAFRGADQNVTIEVDANLVIPEVTRIPLLEMRPHEITEDEAILWRDALCAGYPAYEQIGTMTKEEIEERILSLKQALGEGDSLEEEYGDDPVLLAEMQEYYEQVIAFFESKYASAPENYEREEALWAFHPDSYYSSWDSEDDSDADLLRQSMKFDVLMGQHTYLFRAYNYDGMDYKLHYMHWGTDDRRVYQKEPLNMTEEEVHQIAEDFLQKTGLDAHWRLLSYYEDNTVIDYEVAILADPGNEELLEKAKNPEAEYWYELTFIPEYEGMEVTPQSGIHELKDASDPYAANYHYESLRMKISNGQIIDVYWNAPLEVVSMVNENVHILSWGEIAERFQAQSQIQYTAGYFNQGGDADQVLEAHVKVTEIRLGLARIRQKDSEDSYYLVPAWTFMGEGIADYGRGMPDFIGEEYSLMVINAVDGSIINTALGY